MTAVAKRGVCLFSIVAALAGCPHTAPTPAPSPSSAPVAGPGRSPSPTATPARPSPRPSPSRDPAVQRQLNFSGTTAFALEGPFTLVAGEREFRCFYEGRSQLTVNLIRQDGTTDAQLFVRGGPFSDAARHTVAATHPYSLHITGAGGPWRIEVR